MLVKEVTLQKRFLHAKKSKIEEYGEDRGEDLNGFSKGLCYPYVYV